ncbi:MAG: hypothetical protein FD165_1894 [Gammaproteobacteria bacterium]|nr:MAG: hypothetical protein FD165_1894 [Gammaproteobacteria bacterium]TND04466.1 MAG: hypothetical protein FD120_1580 [Gammaproteobacteria bacterium]
MAGDTPIPERLRQARERAGLSQKALGIKAGIDEFSASPRINQYETGKHTPDFQTMERLAGALGIPTPFFYCRDDVLAELALALGEMSKTQRKDLLKELKGA